ncbi:MAG: amidohydrolase [Chloroflexi bacterium]|nr:amidohydrolase [Chloroflexota bacterium]
MVNRLFEHATLVTLDDESHIYNDASLAIAGDTILALDQIPTDFRPDERIDVGGKVIMPGLYNSHTHAAMTFARGFAEDLPLSRWFNERIWLLESALTPDMVTWGTQLAAIEMIRGGIIGFADHYFHMDKVADVVAQNGMRALLAWAVFGRDASEVGTTVPETVDFIHQTQGAANGRLRACLGPHSPYMCPEDFLARTAAVAVREQFGIHIHAAETAGQVENSLRLYDRTPIEMLNHLGLLETPSLIAHAIHVNNIDLEILSRKRVNIVQCPSTHMKYGMGVTRVPDMMARHINVALGTDGAGSSTALNMWREMRLAVLTQRQAFGTATLLGGSEALHMATRNGAQALGFTNSGILAPGYAADCIIVDTTATHFQPLHDIIAALVWCTEPADVSDVMVAGQWLLRERDLQTIDEAEAREGFEEALALMLASPYTHFQTYDD